MRIALVCHARHPIRAPFAGGLEAHNWHLAKALQARGHDVVLFASGDSDPDFTVSPIIETHAETSFPGQEHRGNPALRDFLDRGYHDACERIDRGGFDIVHNHSLHRLVVQAAHARRWPSVTSLHTPPLGGLEWFVRASVAPYHRVTTVSAAQRDLWWPDGAPDEMEVVPNGIDASQWTGPAEGDGSAVWCGRITPDKGAHLAIRAAASAGVPLTLIGAVEDAHYFATEIAPMLGDRICHVGALSGGALVAAVGRASVFLSTPCWPEPFGLAAIEAMACGVPVAAFDLGAVRAVVGESSGRFAAAGDVAGLATALRHAMVLDRAAARRHVLEHHGLDRMMEDYLALYERVRQTRNHWILKASP